MASRQQLADKMNELLEREHALARRERELEAERALIREGAEKGMGAVLLGEEDLVVSQPPTRKVHALQGHAGGATGCDFSESGFLLASGGHDRTVRVWDAQTGVLKHALTGEQSSS